MSSIYKISDRPMAIHRVIGRIISYRTLIPFKIPFLSSTRFFAPTSIFVCTLDFDTGPMFSRRSAISEDKMRSLINALPELDQPDARHAAADADADADADYFAETTEQIRRQDSPELVPTGHDMHIPEGFEIDCDDARRSADATHCTESPPPSPTTHPKRGTPLKLPPLDTAPTGESPASYSPASGSDMALPKSQSVASLLGALSLSEDLKVPSKLHTCTECGTQIDGAIFFLHDKAFCCQRHRLGAYHHHERCHREGDKAVYDVDSVGRGSGATATGLIGAYQAWC